MVDGVVVVNVDRFERMLDPRLVAAVRDADARYPADAPFHPDTTIVEAPFGERASTPNHAYRAVREAFRIAGLDAPRYGTAAWNPLQGLVRPGETVMLKPNLVKDAHPRDPRGWEYILTHGSIIRAVTDYVWKALEGRGRIWLADAPQTDTSFAAVVRVLGLDALCEYYAARGVAFELLDLRQEEWISRDAVVTERRRLAGDPRGYVAFDLGVKSEFQDHRGRYYGADYDTDEVNYHHSGGRHEYKVARSAIACDVLFNLPKLKTHKKAGITVGLKNLVGINGDKNWLPHHTEGDPSTGGDEHPGGQPMHYAERRIVPYFRALSDRVPLVGAVVHRAARRVGRRLFGDSEEVIRSGNWWGNDTTWRMCLDLNKIALYGNTDGTLRAAVPQERKRHFVLVDGIVAGEGRGPMNPDPHYAGLVAFGTHPASVDAACAVLMGFDPERIPVVREAFRCLAAPIANWGWRDVAIRSNVPAWAQPLGDIDSRETLPFRPHFAWAGHIERDTRVHEHVGA